MTVEAAAFAWAVLFSRAGRIASAGAACVCVFPRGGGSGTRRLNQGAFERLTCTGKRKPTTSGEHRGGCRRLLAPYVGSMWAFLASGWQRRCEWQRPMSRFFGIDHGSASERSGGRWRLRQQNIRGILSSSCGDECETTLSR